MNMQNGLLHIFFGDPFRIPREIETSGFVERIDRRWRLTATGLEEIQPWLTEKAAILFPDDVAIH